MQKNSTITAAINTIIANNFARYKGCIIERKMGAKFPYFVALQKHYKTFAEAKQAIDQAFSNLQISIK
jgi:hypothetical protein